MDEATEIILLADLIESQCSLSHHDGASHPAVDYIVVPFGYNETDIIEVVKREMVIPVCKECLDSLHLDEWILLYCTTCNQSQWVHKTSSEVVYKDGSHIIWVDGCPECKEEVTKVKHG